MNTLLPTDWRMVAFRGAAAVVFGVITLVWPNITLWALVVLFGAYALVDGVVALVGAFSNRVAIGQFSIAQKLPMIARLREYVEDGALISYGPSFVEYFRRAAYYIDKIWKGAKPGDLPIEQPTKFERVISLRNAKAMGIAIPPSLLARADELIR